MLNLGLNIGQYTQEQEVTNSITKSKNLLDAYWQSRYITNWIQSGTDVEGGSDSYQIRATGVNNTHGLRSSNTISLTEGTIYTLSVFAKQQITNKMRIRGDATWFTSSPQGQFDLSNGTFEEINKDGNSAYVETGMQDCGDGWYKCWITFIPDNTATDFVEFLILDSSDNAVFYGDGSQGFLLCHPQINEGYLKKYTETP